MTDIVKNNWGGEIMSKPHINQSLSVTFNHTEYQVQVTTADLSHVHAGNPLGKPIAMTVCEFTTGDVKRGFYLEHLPSDDVTDEALVACRDIIWTHSLINRHKCVSKPRNRKGMK